MALLTKGCYQGLVLSFLLLTLVGIVVILCSLLNPFTLDLTTSRPTVFPLRNTLVGPCRPLVNKLTDRPNRYQYWSNDLVRSLRR